MTLLFLILFMTSPSPRFINESNDASPLILKNGSNSTGKNIVLIFVGFFTLFISWIYGIPIFIVGVLLLTNFGKEDKIEKVKKRGK